jgi:TPR repeat protein
MALRYRKNGETKENVGHDRRKPHPLPPIPTSSQVQAGDLLPPSEGDVLESGQSPREYQPQLQRPDPAEQLLPMTQDLPYRSNYKTPRSDQTHEEPGVALSSGNLANSGPSSNGLLVNQPTSSSPNPTRTNENSKIEEPPVPAVPQFQYHHDEKYTEGIIDNRSTSKPRPISTYSDLGAQGRSLMGQGPGSPSWGTRAHSANSRGSHDRRPLSYVDLANTSYPQAPPAAMNLDNSQLRSVVGANASLMSISKTLDMYRQNVKKLNDSEAQYAFAIFLVQAAQETGLSQEGSDSSRRLSPRPGGRESPYVEKSQSSPYELLNEAKHILQKLADRSYPFGQYYLADGYASGLFSKGKVDYSSAFPLFVAASKHGHAESGYRAALCYEFGWGCRKDPAKAVQFYRQSASKNHPGAMTRLGRACLSGDLGLNRYREGLKWLKRATESADMQYNAAPYHLGLLYETGYGDDIFLDEVYAAQLFTQAADLGHAEACCRLGDAYEQGKLSCPRDPALSVHFYTGAAQKGHPAAMMALCAWYMVGAEPVLEKDENEAYEWARQAAMCGK